MGGVTGWHFAIMRNKKYMLHSYRIIVTVHLAGLSHLPLDLLHQISSILMITVRISSPQKIFIRPKI
jgi:hypothetical protein